MKFVILFILTCTGISGFTQVGIGVATPNSKAQLEIASTNKGLLIPRMPLANRPTTPPVGLMIYQTDQTQGFYYYTGTAWKRMYAVSETDTMTINPNPGNGIDPAPTVGATGTVRGADSITYTTVRLGDGSVWLQQNLGSSRVATAMNDALSYGDLYQWGRWTDGHEKRTPVFSRTITAAEPNPNNPAGLVKQWGANVNPYYYADNSHWWGTTGNTTDTWNAPNPITTNQSNGCDPCRLLLGTTWRLPTRADWVGIIDNQFMTVVSITDAQTGLNSVLKLALAGFRDRNSTSIFELGTSGQYWSSTPDFYYNYQAISFVLLLPSSGYSNKAYINYYEKRGYGLSIRCKKD
jgi:uncharacterized protein (TIGR02145 family)